MATVRSVRVSGLWIYPVKSCAGIALEAMELEPRGPLLDREWMVVDAGGRFVTQRTHPEMARIRPVLKPDRLVLNAPGREPLEVPLEPVTGEALEVEVWRDRCRALSAGAAAAAWLRELLGETVRLVRMPPDEVRPVDPRHGRP
ncbi:MAG TPA: MOSC domain-containing protein, partial [Acidobacteria bacterium]|nr:MOSC domain-containing protein [Acidobacteriota bacterium]